MGQSHDDRRSDPRISATFRVRYRSVDDLVIAYTSDISRGGMFVLTDEPLAVGSIVKVHLELPEEGPEVVCIARVAYVRNTLGDEHRGMGLELLDVVGAPIDQVLLDYLSEDSSAEATGGTIDAHLLVVDDDRLAREQIADALRDHFSRVESAEDGLAALGQALREPPDLILSDVEMPGMDGWQLLRIVRSRNQLAQVPFIFLTRLRGEDERLRGYRMGVDDFLAKPIQIEELYARVQGVLARYRGRSQPKHSDVLRGDLAHVSMASVLSFIAHERRSGHLLVVSGDSLATLHIRNGDVLSAHLSGNNPPERPHERLFEVLDWADGRFEFAPGQVDSEDEIRMATSAVLLEHARRTDEGV